ncbi:hypothetical protein [Candidatus Odyssella thessalonicensis]|uniref:hypothetical protein n=1 Tax=Candidatus Odyssella thessalonicensis TaxID=84647 RepID=UPI0011124F1F|nr:hypothetical protein [Candidatus Odyssella thessalonicensis]
MKNDHDDYYYNPYVATHRAGKGESMSSVRASFVFAFAILTSVAAILLYLDQKERFEMAPARQGLYIFDKKTTATNFCDTYRCVGISPEFILPKKVDVAQIPGVRVNTQIQQPAPTIASLMMPPSQSQAQAALNRSVSQPAPAGGATANLPLAGPSTTLNPPAVAGIDVNKLQAQAAAQQSQTNNSFQVVEDEDMGGFIDSPDN